jgi:hypothetical protein
MHEPNLNLVVMSCNCRGFNATKASYIQSLLARYSVLFLQEHWLSADQLSVLDNLDRNFPSFGISGFDNSDILSGRPFGGCAILWRSDLLTVHILPINNLIAGAFAQPACPMIRLNYYSLIRGIALSSVFGKVFDNIILDRYSARLQSSDLQFGFKAGCSTNDCTMMLRGNLSILCSQSNTYVLRVP